VDADTHNIWMFTADKKLISMDYNNTMDTSLKQPKLIPVFYCLDKNIV
jgi:hypothetical protein